MRENIGLFRGKRTNGGKWVEGSLIHFGDYWAILQNENELHPMDIPYLDSEIGTFDGKATPIDPETVGEFTGLTDKNGRRIFENDIVLTQPFSTRLFSDNKKEKRFYGVVKYQIDVFENKHYKQPYKAEWEVEIWGDTGKYKYWHWSEFWRCEVIGNIHDNPELIERE